MQATIQKWKMIFKDYDGEYVTEEFDCGSPVGKEVW